MFFIGRGLRELSVIRGHRYDIIRSPSVLGVLLGLDSEREIQLQHGSWCLCTTNKQEMIRTPRSRKHVRTNGRKDGKNTRVNGITQNVKRNRDWETSKAIRP